MKQYNQNLGGYLQKLNEISANLLINIMSQILCALKIVHESGYIYNNLKLQNIIIDDNIKIKLIDFGMATKYLND